MVRGVGGRTFSEEGRFSYARVLYQSKREAPTLLREDLRVYTETRSRLELLLESEDRQEVLQLSKKHLKKLEKQPVLFLVLNFDELRPRVDEWYDGTSKEELGRLMTSKTDARPAERIRTRTRLPAIANSAGYLPGYNCRC